MTVRTQASPHRLTEMQQAQVQNRRPVLAQPVVKQAHQVRQNR